MKISLVIRTYNEEKNIGECLEAVLAQTLKPVEILIVDNESNDRTLDIVSSFQDRLPIQVINNIDHSYVSGLNIGVKEASHEVLGFLSADCFPHSDWLKKLSEVMTDKKATVVVGREIVRGNDDIHFVLQHTRHYPDKDKQITFFENSNIIYDKETLKKLLPFVGVGEKRGGEDTILSIQYAKHGYLVQRAGMAVVEHKVYESMEDFRSRTKQQGARLKDFFRKGFLYPRIYLNPFYWSLVEFIYFFRYFDVRFLKIAYLRLIYTIQGMLGK